MAVSPQKPLTDNTLPPLKRLFNLLPEGRIVADKKGQIFFTNHAAHKLLTRNKGIQKNLNELLNITSRNKQDLVKDYPNNERVTRLYARYIKNRRNSLIIVYVSDVTRDWHEEKQKSILEYISSVASQSMPTEMWMSSVLERIKAAMDVRNSTIYLYNRQKQSLEKNVTTGRKNDVKLLVKLNKNPIAKSASQKIPLAVYNARKSGEGLLAIPMVVSDKLVGVLAVEEKPKKFFREKDKDFYEVVANRLAITLEYRSLIEQLRQEYGRLATVIDNTLQGEALLDSRNRVLLANSAFAELVDLNVEKVLGQNIENLIPEIRPLLVGDQARIYKELELTSFEGRPWVGIAVSKIARDKENNTVITIHDITAEKQLEQTKNDFIATATHELRTPLTAIRGYLSMINSKPVNLDPKQKTYLQRIDKASNTLSVLVEDLLSVLRIDQEASKFKPEKLKLLPFIKEAIHGLETKISNKKIRISLSTENYIVYCDANALQKVILNLIDNAVKYTPKNGKVSVKIKPAQPNGRKMIKVSVKDTGVGIPKRQQQRLFEKFARVHNELSVEAGGTGLGLYITKKLIEQWGGTITLKSLPGKGSTFSFTLPAK